MSRIDFLIGNPGHHLAAVEPVARRLAERSGHQCRILSLCEFRGFRTPTAELGKQPVEVRRLVPFRFRSPSSFPQRGNGGGPDRARRLAQALSWQLLLGPRLSRLERTAADLVVVPNDAAFPYDRIASTLRTRRIPFVLLQEGIRFPLPSAVGKQGAYGTGGAVAIAAWGETSADYFRSLGVPEERIHQVGSPRIDAELGRSWQPEVEALRQELELEPEALLYLSNPIDDQGYCSTAEKHELFSRFLSGLTPLLARGGVTLLVKLHGREDPRPFAAAVAQCPRADSIRIVQRAPLYALLQLASAAIILTSTVGLEALACGKPLGVLELPGHGFAADYVSSGAAVGLRWSEPMAAQAASLLADDPARRQAAARYLGRSLANSGTATAELQGLIERLLG